MFPVRLSTCLLLGVAAVSMVVFGDTGNPTQPAQPGKAEQPAAPVTPPKPTNEIVQEFPSNDQMETAWKVEWGTSRGIGVYIKNAWFKSGPKERWMQVLGDARLSEIFVPYHRGSPRFWDVRDYNFPLCVMTREDAGPFGKLLRDQGETQPKVVQELRDRGVIWRGTVGMGGDGVRRGQTLVLWGCLLA